MRDNRNTGGACSPSGHEGRGGLSGRRSYEPPRIVFREPLEAIASTCTGITAKTDPGSCPLGPIQS